MAHWNMSVPTAGSSLNLGASPGSSGVTLTAADGAVLSYSSGNTDLNADGHIWLQSSADAGICSASGVKIGTPAGVLATAGGNVDLWAGAGMGPSVPGPGAAAQVPTPPSPPCEGAKTAADRINALNAGVKGIADIKGALSGDGGKAKKAYEVLKGGWDIAKAMNDCAEGSDKVIDPNAQNATDGIIGVVDGVVGLATGKPVDPIGLYQAATKAIDGGSKLATGDAGAGGKDGEGSSAGGGGGGHGGGGKCTIHAPAGIEKATDANMEAWAAGKIEYKAGSKIALNAGSKVETCSMQFEAHANVKATVRGCAQVTIESGGLVEILSSTLDVKAGAANVDAGRLSVKTGRAQITSGNLKVISPIQVLGKVAIDGKTDIRGDFSVLGNGNVSGNFDIGKNVEIGCQLHVKAQARVDGKIFGKAGASITGPVKLG